MGVLVKQQACGAGPGEERFSTFPGGHAFGGLVFGQERQRLAFFVLCREDVAGGVSGTHFRRHAGHFLCDFDTDLFLPGEIGEVAFVDGLDFVLDVFILLKGNLIVKHYRKVIFFGEKKPLGRVVWC